jgi:hypothetical protein
MNGNRFVALLMLAIWGSWMCAGQALFAASTWTGGLSPDGSLVLLVMVAGALPRQEGLGAAMIIGLARVAHTVDPPAAVLASTLLALIAARSVRRVVDFELPMARAGAAGLAALVVTLWLGLVQAARASSSGVGGAGERMTDSLLTAPAAALSAAVVALVFGPVLLRLPGLTPLRKQRW